MEHFSFDTRCVPKPAASRFAKKTRCFRLFWAGALCRLAFLTFAPAKARWGREIPRAVSEPTGGPAQLEGNNAYLKFCDLNYLVHTAQGTTDTVGALSALFQRVPVIEGQKYRVTVRARNYSPHTNSWYPNRVQLQVHNASMKTTLVETSGDGFCPGNFEAYVSNSANATTKNNGSSANNDWQTLELEFTAPAGGSVSLGIFINNQGVTDSWHAVLIDDFRMEYVK